MKREFNVPRIVPQKVMCRSADQKYLGLCRMFNDIMSGSNPLTVEEMRRLVAKRPVRYGFMRAWIERLEAEDREVP